MTWELRQGDCLEVLPTLPADSINLIMGSPPYEAQRTYGIGFDLKGQEWVDWMVEVFRQCSRVCTGLVCMVVEGFTRDYRWSATPALLMADLHRAGLCLRKPPVYRRVGIPGSGGPDWLRNDYEFCVCVSRPGRLPWSDNTAMGHPPKWAPGGEMSHRLSDGTRRNQWGRNETSDSGKGRDGEKDDRPRPPSVITSLKEKKRRVTRGHANGDTATSDGYDPPAIANPGNVVVKTYTADEVDELLGTPGDVMTMKVGGNLMGSELCHENEAPYPEALAEFFVRSFCPPETGTVLDPFSGSGTTGAVAVRWRRNFIGIDVRESQVELSRRRIGLETPMMPGMA